MEKEKDKKSKKHPKKYLNIKKVKLDSNKDIFDVPNLKSLTTKHAPIKERKQIRPESSKFSANVNNYRFLFDITNKESVENNKWVINLRVYDNFKKRKKKLLGEPTFYQNDLDKFIKNKRTRLTKSKSAFEFNTLSNYTQYKHLFKKFEDNHGFILTGPLLKYKMNLRNFSNLTPQHKWISNTNIDSNKYYYSCSNFFKDKIHGRMTDKNIMRPYKIEFSKSEYNGHKLLVKKAKRDEKKAYDIMGDHLALKPYNDKYSEKNMFQINELLKSYEKSQSRTLYHIKLRNYNDGKKEYNKKRWKNW